MVTILDVVLSATRDSYPPWPLPTKKVNWYLKNEQKTGDTIVREVIVTTIRSAGHGWKKVYIEAVLIKWGIAPWVFTKGELFLDGHKDKCLHFHRGSLDNFDTASAYDLRFKDLYGQANAIVSESLKEKTLWLIQAMRQVEPKK